MVTLNVFNKFIFKLSESEKEVIRAKSTDIEENDEGVTSKFFIIFYFIL